MPYASHSTTEDRFCPHCKTATRVHDVTKAETLPVRGEPIKYTAHLYRCEICGKDFASEEQEERNFQEAYDVYRQRHNLLPPAQIRAIRNKYGLSQTNFSLLLGWGEITVHRYENGALPDTAHNELLVLLDDPRNAEKILGLNKSDLPEGLVSKLSERILLLAREEYNPLKCWLRWTEDQSFSVADINAGYRLFDLNKFENLTLYLLHKCPDVYKTKLNKLLWYCDFKHFKVHTVSLTGSRYVHLPYGPVPDNYELHLWKLRSENKIRSVENVFRSCAGEKLIASANPDQKGFSVTELKVIDYVVDKLGSLSAKALSDESHKERAYAETGETDIIPYGYAVKLSI